ncbi:alpha/beta hydrolase family protein [Streptomyces phaeochromogenes]|uniref:alpha/beta hydrolase family protein n=1 Tax=Streptomyces phaeochromogenes TaxID=1923 RepID=UPI003723A46F
MSSSALPRREFLAATALALGPLAGTPAARAQSRPARSSAIRLRLPEPTGPCTIGTVSLQLTDRTRPDPWMPSVPHRELMISVWYPALAPRRGQGLAPYMERGVAERFDALEPHRIPSGTVDWAGTRTHAYREAPVDPRGGRRPVVVYSPGVGDPRSWGTLLAEELASHGYVVVAVDHTYESPGVQFPDGSVKTNEVLVEEFAAAQREGTVPALLEKTLRARVADARSVVDRLGTLPYGLSEVLDTHRVGLAGQSGGGFTAAQSMYEDRRIRAGIDLDGTLEFNQEPNGTNLSPVAAHGLDRPFLLMGREGSDHARTEPSWAAFWSHSTGWRRDLTLHGSRHQTYTDLAAVMPQTGLGQDMVEETIGTIDPTRAVTVIRACVTSFFDRWLRDRDDHVLDGPSASLPGVTFVW